MGSTLNFPLNKSKILVRTTVYLRGTHTISQLRHSLIVELATTAKEFCSRRRQKNSREV
ncbi:hypothetical protein PROFUN_00974 [Planoprotostelium fungivorum]|uniref:Uncharacterized protein n=1 Tax=Planoprotostelium fungivorum TaxID=1890364 RepID=A0A2P6N4D7_9EUKA|nr:hypothetical protein PROFUN_00974 [Planoprotostelium fungivorum]